MPTPNDFDHAVVTADLAPTGDAATLTSRPPPVAAAGWRYALGEEIGQGGMGVVYRATDSAFGRDVAVKVLHEKYGPDSGAARRFADEARITGQLQHPAIPPVHDLGSLPDGRPFLAMKLIRGRTLEQWLLDRAELTAERGRFVAAFEQVCQALAYAHSHSVIHRDLKPANIMVGNYGEVQVMDWGLAKVLSVGRVAGEADLRQTSAGTQILSLRDSDELFTQAGSVLGTPAFMPPEQAVGAVGKVDARSDVFGLGAILAVILTGKPPFASSSAETTRVKAAQGDVADCFARLDACGAEPELVALCKRCLSPKPADRPRDADEVAKAVAQLRVDADERARRAELERVKAEGEKVAAELQAAEQQKRRRVQLALAAALLVLLAGSTAFAWWQHGQTRDRRARLERNAQALTALLDGCKDALGADDADRAAARLEEAERRLSEGGPDHLRNRLAACRTDIAMLRELDAIDRFRWTTVESNLSSEKEVPNRLRQAFGGFGVVPGETPVDEAARRVTDSAIRDRLLSALDRWLFWGSADVRAILRAADPNDFRDAMRDAVARSARSAELASRAEALDQPAGFVAVVGGNASVAVARRRELLSAALLRRPGNLHLLVTMGNTYPINQRAGAEERVRWYQAAIAAHPRNVVAHYNLGIALWDKRDVDGAIASYKEAIRLDRNLVRAHYPLGIALWEKGDVDGAIASYTEAVRLDVKHAPTHFNLGFALRKKGDLDGAIANFEEAIRLAPQLVSAQNLLRRTVRDQQLLPRLPDVLAGKVEPKSPAEACEFADLCGQPFQRRFAAAVRLYEKAFAADPKLADLVARHRYNAACEAVRAASGEGIDSPTDAADRLDLRNKALTWLRADLTHWKKQAASANADERKKVAAKMTHWQADTDLAGVREAMPLGELPDGERQTWQALWAEVKATLAQAQMPPPPPELLPPPLIES